MTTRTIEGAAVRTAGEGPPLVLLHANGGDSSDFDAVADRLASTHTVHAIDWPGWGRAEADPTPSALRYAALLPRVLDALGGGPFVLLGNSVGGFAAVRTAAARPDLVRALVLVDPGGFTARWPGSVLACRVIGSARVAPTMMRVLPRLYLRHRNATVDTIRSNATAMSRDPARVAAFASIWRSFAEPAHDARDAAARVTAPTMLVWGRRDPVLPWWTDGRRARRAFPNAAIAPLPCGHQAFAELPDAFLASVEPFLTDIPEEAP